MHVLLLLVSFASIRLYYILISMAWILQTKYYQNALCHLSIFLRYELVYTSAQLIFVSLHPFFSLAYP